MPPRSEHRWANLVFDGQLEAMLRAWRTEGVSYERIAEAINLDLAARAKAVGDEAIVVSYVAVKRWARDGYGIE